MTRRSQTASYLGVGCATQRPVPAASPARWCRCARPDCPARKPVNPPASPLVGLSGCTRQQLSWPGGRRPRWSSACTGPARRAPDWSSDKSNAFRYAWHSRRHGRLGGRAARQLARIARRCPTPPPLTAAPAPRGRPGASRRWARCGRSSALPGEPPAGAAARSRRSRRRRSARQRRPAG